MSCIGFETQSLEYPEVNLQHKLNTIVRHAHRNEVPEVLALLQTLPPPPSAFEGALNQAALEALKNRNAALFYALMSRWHNSTVWEHDAWWQERISTLNMVGPLRAYRNSPPIALHNLRQL